MDRLELAGWVAVAVVLSALAIPWFLWNDATIVAGLPLWLWWHVGWMGLVSIVFWVFARRAWGIGIETGPGSDDSSEPNDLQGERPDRSSASAGGGERR